MFFIFLITKLILFKLSNVNARDIGLDLGLAKSGSELPFLYSDLQIFLQIRMRVKSLPDPGIYSKYPNLQKLNLNN